LGALSGERVFEEKVHEFRKGKKKQRIRIKKREGSKKRVPVVHQPALRKGNARRGATQAKGTRFSEKQKVGGRRLRAMPPKKTQIPAEEKERLIVPVQGKEKRKVMTKSFFSATGATI